jgi:HD-GYP domain-containing protein (c-di-GMP phosphodiesterase class II)
VSVKERIAAVETPHFGSKLYSIAALVTLIVLTGMWLISRYAALDLERDLQTWREKLNLVAESRTEAMNDWMGEQFKTLRTLADNPSLQLYMTELQAVPAPVGESAQSGAAQKSYLRNLLLFTADRGGFAEAGNTDIRANVQQESKSGLAVLNANNEVVVSTTMDSATREMLLKEAAAVTAGKEGFIDIRKNSNGQTVLGFVVPVFSIQGERTPEAQIGKVAGIRLIDDKWFAMLKHPGVVEKTLEVVLARKPSAGKIEFVSLLQDGSKPLAKQIDFDQRRYAETDLMQTAGNFSSVKKDYRDRPVFATSRLIQQTPWVLIAKIDRDEALTASNQHRANIVTTFFMLIVIIVLIVVAVWWYAHSRRAIFMSRHFRRLAAQAVAQEELLRVVTDNQPEPIYIVDHRHIVQFANQQAAEIAKTNIADLIGKTLADVKGASRAEAIGAQCDKAIKQRQVVYDTANVRAGKEDRIIQSAYIPLEQIPIITLPPDTKGVIIVDQDISDAVHERERRIEIQQQIVHTLVRLVDRRDPFAANHSTLVSMMAYEVASDMQLDEVTIETTRLAGNLMNVGKIVIAPELLTKTDDLSDDEKKAIRNSMQSAVDLLKGIPFDGPVADTLRQWQEKWDGTGPLGMKGENILISARIIAVSNAFIGMISPRSWRMAMPIEKANQFLLDNVDTHFDRKVVIALINHVENHRGKQWIQRAIEEKRNAA